MALWFNATYNNVSLAMYLIEYMTMGVLPPCMDLIKRLNNNFSYAHFKLIGLHGQIAGII